MKEELIEHTKDILKELISEWFGAELELKITPRLATYIIDDMADIIDILNNYEKYE